jgi:hypothetical protein
MFVSACQTINTATKATVPPNFYRKRNGQIENYFILKLYKNNHY